MKGILVIALCFLFIYGNSQWEKKYTQLANLSLEDGDYNAADSLYNLALEEDSTFLPALYNRALLTYKQGDFLNAESAFTSLIEKTQDSLRANSFFNRGNCRVKAWFLMDLELNRINEEIDNSEIVEEEDVRVKMKKYLLKDSLMVVKKELLTRKDKYLDASIADYKNTIRLNSNDDDARYNLLYTYGLKPIIEEEKKQDQKTQEQKKKEKKKEPSSFVKESYQKALGLIEENKFTEAYNLLNDGLAKDEGLNKHKNLIDKLKIISEIIEK